LHPVTFARASTPGLGATADAKQELLQLIPYGRIDDPTDVARALA
jgi:hypothetical protein